MSRTVYLHIGMGRCGSTAIQEFCETRRAQLAGRGLAYPLGDELGYENRPGGLRLALMKAKDYKLGFKDRVVRYASSAPYERYLVSSEYFLNKYPLAEYTALRDALAAAGIDLRVFAYVREQREWLLSRYAQGVKAKRWTQSLETYVLKHHTHESLEYHVRLHALAEAVGRERLTVRIFEREHLHEGDVRSDAMALTGTDVHDLLDEDQETNASGSVIEIEALRMLNENRQPDDVNGGTFLRRARIYGNRMGWQPTFDFYRLVDPKVMRKVADEFRESNRALQREFFPEMEAGPFRNSIPDDYQPHADWAEMRRRGEELIAHCGKKISAPGAKAAG